MTIIFSEQIVPNGDQTLQDIFLLLDEVPCNSDPGFDKMLFGRPSGDWKSLKTNGVNLMMVLKPVDNSVMKGFYSFLIDKILSRKTVIDLCLPDDIAHLQLSRIYRCTKKIAEFYEEMVTHLNNPDIGVNYGMSSSSILYSPGHEIHGDLPEVLLLPKCKCFGQCRYPVKHLLQANDTIILAMLKRIQSKFKTSEVTVLIAGTSKLAQECNNWMKTELNKENVTVTNIVFKTIGECRGLEFPVLLTISFSSNYSSASTTLDVWTRVTASLFIIQADNEYSSVSQGLKECLMKKCALEAREQKKFKHNFLRTVYLFFHCPLFVRTVFTFFICIFIFLSVHLLISENPGGPILLGWLFIFLLLSSFLLYVQNLHHRHLQKFGRQNF